MTCLHPQELYTASEKQRFKVAISQYKLGISPSALCSKTSITAGITALKIIELSRHAMEGMLHVACCMQAHHKLTCSLSKDRVRLVVQVGQQGVQPGAAIRAQKQTPPGGAWLNLKAV